MDIVIYSPKAMVDKWTQIKIKDKKEQVKMMSSFCFFVYVCGDLEPTTVKKRTCGNHYPDSFISFFDRVTRLVDWGRLWKQGILILDICQDPPLAQFKSLPFREAPKTSAMGLSSLYLTHQEPFSFAVVWSI